MGWSPEPVPAGPLGARHQRHVSNQHRGGASEGGRPGVPAPLPTNKWDVRYGFGFVFTLISKCFFKHPKETFSSFFSFFLFSSFMSLGGPVSHHFSKWVRKWEMMSDGGIRALKWYITDWLYKKKNSFLLFGLFKKYIYRIFARASTIARAEPASPILKFVQNAFLYFVLLHYLEKQSHLIFFSITITLRHLEF